MTADKLTVGQKAVIISCSCQPMEDIGFTPGERIKVITVAMFGGSKVMQVGASTFALRDKELTTVEVTIV